MQRNKNGSVMLSVDEHAAMVARGEIMAETVLADSNAQREERRVARPCGVDAAALYEAREIQRAKHADAVVASIAAKRAG